MDGDRGRDTHVQTHIHAHTHVRNEIEKEREASITCGKRMEEQRGMGGWKGCNRMRAGEGRGAYVETRAADTS